MWMWPIAAINVVPGQRRWAVAGGSNVAAAGLNTTSCSVMRTGVEVCRVGLTPAEAGPITGAAGLDSKCNMCGCLRDDWWLRAGATVSEHLEDKHHHGRNTSSKLMRSDLSFPQASMPAVGALVRCTDGAYMVRPPQDCPVGHRLQPGHMLVGSIACSCGGHITWSCHCGATTYGPLLGDGCSLARRRGVVPVSL